MKGSAEGIKLNIDLIPSSTILRAMQRLRDIPKEMHNIFQRIGTMFIESAVLNTSLQNSSVVFNRRNDTATLRRTIAIIFDVAGMRRAMAQWLSSPGAFTHHLHQQNASHRSIRFDLVDLPSWLRCQWIHGRKVHQRTFSE